MLLAKDKAGISRHRSRDHQRASHVASAAKVNFCSATTSSKHINIASNQTCFRLQSQQHKRLTSVKAHAAGHQHSSPPDQAHTREQPARLAVFVSGGGSNMKALHAAIQDGRINAKIAVVVSDVPSCGGVAYAQQHGIPTLTFPMPKKGGFTGLSTEELIIALTGTHPVDYVILAGYLKLIPAELVRAFPRAMLNIHPGLLPAFGGKGMYGQRVHQAVISSGARFSGPTVHFVDEEFDTGPILAQRVVPVYPTDTPPQLAGRVLKEEHQVYPEAVSALVDGRITWREDGIPIIWSAH